MTVHLFIGGPADAQRVEIAHPPPWTVLWPLPLYVDPRVNAEDGQQADRVQYVRRELRDGGETHYVYTHGTQEASMTSGAIRELIAGYKRFST